MASLAFVGGSALTVGEGGRGFVSAALADPLAVLGARSPGARANGALTTTKPALASARGGAGGPGAGGPIVPSERVLPTVRDRPGAGLPGVPAVGLVPGAPILGDGSSGGTSVLNPGGGFVPPGGGILVPGGGGSSGGVIVPNPEPPVTAVPEPTVWATMILGVFAIGVMLRRRRRIVRRIGISRG